MISPKKPKPPKQTTLYFAVIDGDDPNKWPLFGKNFPDLVTAARKAAKPHKVPDRLRRLFNVVVEPLLIGPDELMEEQNLDKVVGVIIDALPKTAPEAPFFDRKLDLLKNLYLKQVEKSDKPLFRRFGYKVWFATDNTESQEIARFVENVRYVLEGSLKQKARVDVDYIIDEGILSYLMMQCLHDAYFVLAEGSN
jgi:hypothetical protein